MKGADKKDEKGKLKKRDEFKLSAVEEKFKATSENDEFLEF